MKRYEYTMGRSDFPLYWLIKAAKLRHNTYRNFYTRFIKATWDVKDCLEDNVLRYLREKWDNYKKPTIEEIFKIENLEIRRLCFDFLPPKEIMEKINAKRIAVEGIELNYFRYNEKLEKVPFTKHSIYEIYEGEANLIFENIEGKLYSIKMWCSTTEEEHWMWTTEEYKDDPLAAIAANCWMHKNIMPFVTGIKRQGDIFIFEKSQQIKPEGTQVSLTKEQYFDWLICET